MSPDQQLLALFGIAVFIGLLCMLVSEFANDDKEDV